MPIMDIVKRSDFPVLGADAPQDYPEDILKRHVVADGDEAPRANPTSLLSQFWKTWRASKPCHPARDRDEYRKGAALAGKQKQ